jgi:hypothetical protein
MNQAPRRARVIARTTHIVVALLLGTMVYAPRDVADALRPFMMYVGVPAASLSGLFLWKQALFARWLAPTRRP